MLFLVFFKYYDKSFYVWSNRTFLGLSFFKCPVFKQERYVSDDTTGEIQMVVIAAWKHYPERFFFYSGFVFYRLDPYAAAYGLDIILGKNDENTGCYECRFPVECNICTETFLYAKYGGMAGGTFGFYAGPVSYTHLAGMMSNPGVAAKMFESLYNEGVNINMISTSEIRVTVLINEKEGIRAMNAVHDAFDLAD